MDKRWPGWVYGSGDEPDPRFSLANERTFLAWSRTALALLVAGVALQALPLGLPGPARRTLAVIFVVMSVTAAAAGWLRWAQVERAIRRAQPLPGFPIGALLAFGTSAAGLVLLALLALG